MKTVTLKNCIRFVSILLMAGSQSLFGQLVTNLTTGNTYSTIQAAIDDPFTLNGHTLNVDPGVYAENVLVNKELTINGPKMGVDGNDPSRGTGEAIVHPGVIYFSDGIYWASGGKIFNITADNVTIDGFTLDGDNPNLESGYVINGASPDCESGISSHGGYDGADPDLAGDNLVLKNNIIKNLMGYGIIMWGAYLNTTSQSAVISHNKIQNIFWGSGIWLGLNYFATIEYNAISQTRTGVNIYFYWLQNSSTYPGRIENNTVNSEILEINDEVGYTDVMGISISLVYNGITDTWNIADNECTNLSTRCTGSKGLYSVINWSPMALTITNNNISGYESGYDIRSSGNGGEGLTPPPTQALTVTGGIVSDCKYGVWATNLSYSLAQSAMYNINQVTFIDNTDAGIFVDDESPLNANPSTVAAHANNCIFTGSPVGIKLYGDYAYGSAHNNDLSDISSFAIENLSPNTVEATCNWYGHWTGPINDDNQGGMGTEVSGPVMFDPWVTSGADDNMGQPGFQPEPGSCVPIKCGNNSTKYLFCHNGKTKCVGYEDALIHIAHGDPFGACAEELFISGPGTPGIFDDENITVSSFPNPFANSTTINYGLASDGKVTIKVYDAMGQEVASLIDSERTAGVYTLDFDASALGNGVYYYVVIANTSDQEFVQTGKMIKL